MEGAAAQDPIVARPEKNPPDLTPAFLSTLTLISNSKIVLNAKKSQFLSVVDTFEHDPIFSPLFEVRPSRTFFGKALHISRLTLSPKPLVILKFTVAIYAVMLIVNR